MFIALNGQLGSGKSTICKILEKECGFDTFSTGKIQRAFANELGISTLELNERAKSDYSYDYEIDRRLVRYAEDNTDKDIIFDSRMAWHFIKGAYKIHLLVCPAIAAKRVYGQRESSEETYKSFEEAMEELIKRRQVETERYMSVYRVNMTNLNNYDLIIDTSCLTPQEVCDLIVWHIKDGKHDKPALYVSPKNIYPTCKISSINADTVKNYEEKIKKGENVAPVELIKTQDNLYIYDGHHRVMAQNLCGASLIRANLLCQDGEEITSGVSANDYVKTTMADISDWEKANGFVFGYYPQRAL